jgi:NAD(P)-dependent dehydrogenase (short-subunit alcohol dehydrogenase family)
MAHIFITGSTDGLGRAAAQALIGQGHRVVLHARSQQRASALADLSPRSAGVVVGDLGSAVETWSVADQVNAIGRMEAVIHNAGIYTVPSRSPTPEGHASSLAVNTLAPYMLTGLIERPRRLIYLSSGMHRSGTGPLHDIDWTERRWDTTRAYSESKLYVAALALAVARHWPDVLSHAVDPGWVPTRMGAPELRTIWRRGIAPRPGSPQAMILRPSSVVATGITASGRPQPHKQPILPSRTNLWPDLRT